MKKIVGDWWMFFGCWILTMMLCSINMWFIVPASIIFAGFLVKLLGDE